MNVPSIVLVGGPDSGKSNYIGRVWLSLKARKSRLQRDGLPRNVGYVEQICEHLLKAEFAGRTPINQERQDFAVPVRFSGGRESVELVVPDFSGELWRSAVVESELPSEWMAQLERSGGALLFVRVRSPLNVQPMDWVTARDVLALAGDRTNGQELPTQVMLCELLRLLSSRLKRSDGAKPRIAVVVAAWDELDRERQERGVLDFLWQEFPLFAGSLGSEENVEVSYFGVSVVGSNLQGAARDACLAGNISDMGYVVHERNGVWAHDSDVTLPLAWVMRATP